METLSKPEECLIVTMAIVWQKLKIRKGEGLGKNHLWALGRDAHARRDK